jgi:hypothetical protein
MLKSFLTHSEHLKFPLHISCVTVNTLWTTFWLSDVQVDNSYGCNLRYSFKLRDAILMVFIQKLTAQYFSNRKHGHALFMTANAVNGEENGNLITQGSCSMLT